MIPEEFVECGVFINPHDFLNWYDGIAVWRSQYEVMLCDKHILSCKLWQSGKFFFCLLKHLPWMPKHYKILAGWCQKWKGDHQNMVNQIAYRIDKAAKIKDKQDC